jgi:hypothetical protein
LICAHFPGNGLGEHLSRTGTLQLSILRIFCSKINKKMNRFCIKIGPARFRPVRPILLSQKGLAAQHINPVHDFRHSRLFKIGHNPPSDGTVLV